MLRPQDPTQGVIPQVNEAQQYLNRAPTYAPTADETADKPLNVSANVDGQSMLEFTPGVSVQQEPVSFFNTDDIMGIPTDKYADMKANRFDFALGETSPGVDNIKNDLLTGGEEVNRLRESLKEKTDLNLRRARLAQGYISAISESEITPEQVQTLQNLDKREVDEAYSNPATFYERKFAKKSAEIVTAQDAGEGTPFNPVTEAIESFKAPMVNQAIARKFYEDAHSNLEKRGWGDTIQSFIPFHSWVQMSSSIGGNGFFLGNQIEDAVAEAYRMNPDEFYTTQKAVIDKLAEQDPAHAAQYAAALLGYTSSSKFLDNAFNVLDLSIITPGTAVAVKNLAVATTKASVAAPSIYINNLKTVAAANKIRGMTKNLTGSEIDYIAILPEARKAQQSAVASLRSRAAATGQQADWDAFEHTVQDLMNPTRVMAGSDNMTAEAAARLEAALLRSSTNSLEELVSKPRSLPRLSDTEASVAFSEAEQYVERMYTNATLGSRVVRLAGANHTVKSTDALQGTDMIASYVGTKDGSGYATAAGAKGAATKLGMKKFTTEEVDGKHYIKFFTAVDETTPTQKAFRDTTNKYADKDHTSWIHGVMSRIRMRDSLVPDALAEDFKFAQSATNMYFAKNRDQFISDFEGLSRSSKKDLDNYLETERDFREQSGPLGDPNSVIRGRYSKTVGELNQNFQKQMGRMPTEGETRAYFSWKNWNDVDYAVRNLDLTRDMVRLGIQNVQIRHRLPGQVDSQWTPDLEGKILVEFPWNRKGDAGILVWDAAEPWRSSYLRKSYIPNENSPYVYDVVKDKANRKASPYSKAEIDDLIANKGYRVVHLTPWSKKKFSDYMKTWGREGPSLPPEPQGIDELTKAGKVKLADNPGAKYQELQDAALEPESKEFYFRMANDPQFKNTMEAEGIPKTRADRANAMIKYDTNSTGGYKGPSSQKSGVDVRSQSLWSRAQDKGGKYTGEDLPDVVAATPEPKNTLIDEDIEGIGKLNTGDEVYISSGDGTILNDKPVKIIGFKENAGGDLGMAVQVEGTDSLVSLKNVSKNKKDLINRAKPGTLTQKDLAAVRKWAAQKYGEGTIVRGTFTGEFSIIPSDPSKPYILTKGNMNDLIKEGYTPLAKAEEVLDVRRTPAPEPKPDLPSKRGLEAQKLEEGYDTPNYDYILVKQEEDMKNGALDFTRFPRQEGGHRLDESSYSYVRQPQIFNTTRDKSGINIYEGDTNAYSAALESDAKEFATHMNQVRAILDDDITNGTNNAEAYYIRHMDGTSSDFKTFRNQFKQAHKDGHLDTKTPFYVTPKDKSTWDYLRTDLADTQGNLRYPNLENARDSDHNLFYNELNLKFALERSDNLERVVRKGSSQFPVFGTTTASNLSPMATLINSTSSLIRGRVIDDLKIKAAENFGKAYAAVIDASAEEIRRDPMFYILNPTWKQGLEGADETLLNNAKDYRRAVVDFLGVENTSRDFMQGIQRKVADSLKKNLGEGSYDWVDRHLLRGNYINPVRWANNVTFDLFFGMFNVKQLAVQAMTSFHTAAVLGPKLGLEAGFAAHFARPLLWNKNPARDAIMASRYAKAYGPLGGPSKEVFLEALQSYRSSGWHIVGAETAMRDDFVNQMVMDGTFDNARNKARVFFNEGDKFTRGTGYFGAFFEWRAKNPTAKLTPAIERQILNRADTLTLNMTAASNASIAQGAAAIPLKFTTYYARLAEQMMPGWTGSKLTPQERMRAYAMYSTMFGAPITAGGAFGVWPLYKEWAQHLNEQGYDTDENKVLKFFNEGLAGILPAMVGLDQNFSEALGPTGSNWLYDIVNGKSPIFEIVTGVGGTKLTETFEQTWPFFTFMANAFRDDDERYPLSFSDLENLARSVSSVNNTWRSIQMYNTGIYMSKNRTPLMQGVTGTDAAMSFLFGTQPSKLSEAFIKSDMVRETQEMKRSAKRDILKYHRLQMKSITERDEEGALHYGKVIKYLTQANGFTPDELNALFSDSITSNIDMVHKAEKDFNESTPERQKMWMESIKRKGEQPGG